MNPILFEIQGFTIYMFWIFFALGVIFAVFTIIKLSEKNGLKLAFFSENSWKIFLWALIGARILSLIENYQTYFAEINLDFFLRLFAIWDKGLNIWGAVIGMLVYFFFLCKSKEQNFFKWLDVLIPSIIIGLAFGHIGAFFEGINYGTPTSLPWGVNFESPKIKYTVPIHPTQIYAFLYSILLSVSLILSPHLKKIKELQPEGFIGLIGIAIYSFFSFLEEFIRGDDTLTILGIRIPQILCFLIALSTGIFLYLRYNRPKLTSKKKLK